MRDKPRGGQAGSFFWESEVAHVLLGGALDEVDTSLDVGLETFDGFV